MSEMNMFPRGVSLKTSGIQKELKSTSSTLQPASIELWRFLLIILIVSVIAITLTILIEFFMSNFFSDTTDIRWTMTSMPTFAL